MKRLISLLVLAAGLMSASAVSAAEQTIRLAVANMTCAACPSIVRKSISAVPGVSNVVVSLEQNAATVTFDDQVATVDALSAAATNAGFPAKLAAAEAPKT